MSTPAADRSLAAAMQRLDTRLDWERRDRRRMAVGLEPVRHLLARLGQPQRRLRVVHLAGTKGRGSVGALLAAALHTVLDCGDAAQAESPAGAATEATHVDVLTTAAFVLFARAGVQMAVIEVGLDGRHDSTNVVQPLAADKPALLGVLRGRIAALVCTTLAGARDGWPAESLAQEARRLCPRRDVHAAPSMADGLQLACSLARTTGTGVLATGTLHLLPELLVVLPAYFDGAAPEDVVT